MLFLTFQLGVDRYALDAKRVAEVLPLVDIKQIPHAPAGVAGVFNYRGTPVPVIGIWMEGLAGSLVVSVRVAVCGPTTAGPKRMVKFWTAAGTTVTGEDSTIPNRGFELTTDATRFAVPVLRTTRVKDRV